MLRTATRVLHGSQHITHPAWSAAAEAAADTIWRRGLLKKVTLSCYEFVVELPVQEQGM